MNKRINELVKLTLEGKMHATPVKTEYDREDMFLSRQQMESKRLCEFILNQEPILSEFSKMTGFFNCDGSVVGDAFRRMGHKNFEKLRADFYLKHIDNLSTCEWQHATADYKKQSATVEVEGANGYAAVEYNIWIYEPASIAITEVHELVIG